MQEEVGCQLCNKSIPFHARNCPYCQADVGFPNVRAALIKPETDALDSSYNAACADAEGDGVGEILSHFGSVVEGDSKAVICRSLTDILHWMLPGNLYTSFHNNVTIGARVAQDNRYDRQRGSVDELFFPQYSQQIVFAALSLDGYGTKYYGQCSVTIRSDAIATRATLFEENTLKFTEKRNIKYGSEIPAGFRSSWSSRGKLAVSKLYKQVTSETKQEDYAKLLLRDANGQPDDDGDFLEVHIYGPIAGDAIEAIACNSTWARGEKPMLNRAVKEAASRNIIVKIS